MTKYSNLYFTESYQKAWALIEAAKAFGSSAVFTNSFSREDMVIHRMISNLVQDLDNRIEVVTLDTGRLPEETLGYKTLVEEIYGIPIKTYFPPLADVEDLVNKSGHHSFRTSLAARRECCRIRKVVPLSRALYGKRLWITGLRSGQAATREKVPEIEFDAKRKILKMSPLANWSSEDVKRYTEVNHIPEHPLYAEGYTSIGCAPCTRAVNPGEDERAGRWWWEDPETKECGLHG